jgi:5-(carboxyamino)imidazole ribonucleotide synthase
MDDLPPVRPGMVVGILGGGQLGRMLALAAAELGLSCHIYCPDPKSPAFAVAAARTVAPYDDEAALAAFAAAVDVVTYEFENVPAATARFLAERVALLPSPRSLEIAQDRFLEKDFVARLGIATPGYAEVARQGDIYSALARTGRPAILKTRRLGYDGKGQALIRTGDDPVSAWRAIGEVPATLESFVAFEREVSVIIARGRDGAARTFDVAENVHAGGILAETRVPAALPAAARAAAVALAGRIADALDHVGVLAVEMFVVPIGSDKRVLVNEIAPRVHNSGHWTSDACLISQFEQHIRAVCGWPLADPARHSDATMTNLIGEEVASWPALAAEPGARLHLYGKSEARPGRKMGHVTRLRPRTAES